MISAGTASGFSLKLIASRAPLSSGPDAREGGGGRDVAVPGAGARGAALRRRGQPGAKLRLEGGGEPVSPVDRHAAGKRAVRLDDDIVALGQADDACFSPMTSPRMS